MIKNHLQTALKKFKIELESYENTVSDMGCRCIKFKLKDQYMPEMQVEYWNTHHDKKTILIKLMQEISDNAKKVARQTMDKGANRDVVDYYDELSWNIKNKFF